MNEKSIAILKISFHSNGGLEKQTKYIYNKLIEKGYKVSILTTKSQDDIEANKNVNFVYMKKWPFLSVLKIFLFDLFCKKWIKKNKPSIVLAIDRTTCQTHIRAGNGVHRAYLNQRLKSSNFIKKIFLKINPLHLLILSKEKKAFEDKNLQKVIVNSRMVKNEILQFYKIDKDKIEVVHNPIDLEKNKSDFNQKFDLQNEIKSSLNIPQETKVFLFIGSGYKRKGLGLIIEAVKKMKSNPNTNPADQDFVILVIGKDKNLNLYRKKVIKDGIDDKIRFLGPQKSDDIIKFLIASDFALIPSIYDPFANVTVEALSMGCFVLTSKENGGSEIINPENGIILNNIFDIDDIAQNIKKCLTIAIDKAKAAQIRDSICHLDTKWQLEKIVDILIKK